MRIWIDTEFNEYHGALISMALVAEDGREWYGVRFCDDPGWWVREHVMPQLLQQPERDADLRTGLAEFLGQFDAVHIVSDWPGDIAHFCNFLEYAPGDRIGPDTMTFEVRRDLPDTATTSAIPHNALEDARALAKARAAMGEIAFRQEVVAFGAELASGEDVRNRGAALVARIKKALVVNGGAV